MFKIMPLYCAAFGCKNKQIKNGPSFHRFPKDEGRRKKWEAAVRREGWHPTEYTRICGDHFVTG